MVLLKFSLYGRPTQLNISNKASATVLALISFKATASEKQWKTRKTNIYLYPSEGGLIGRMISTQIIENGVPANGNFPIGTFATVPFDTFLWHKSHDATYRVTLSMSHHIETYIELYWAILSIYILSDQWQTCYPQNPRIMRWSLALP